MAGVLMSGEEKSRAKVLVAITDGVDTDDEEGGSFRYRAERLLKANPVFLLTCCVGRADVNEDDMSRLALSTGGHHIAVATSSEIAIALAELTEHLHIRILHATQVSNEHDLVVASQQTVIERSVERIAVDLLALIDCSLSMEGMDGNGRRTGDSMKLPAAKEAAITVRCRSPFSRRFMLHSVARVDSFGRRPAPRDVGTEHARRASAPPRHPRGAHNTPCGRPPSLWASQSRSAGA